MTERPLQIEVTDEWVTIRMKRVGPATGPDKVLSESKKSVMLATTRGIKATSVDLPAPDFRQVLINCSVFVENTID
jgi:hypothetical protein